jgi:hypothetical protein
MRRRWQIVGLLALASLTYWLGSWAWIRASVAELDAGGAHELTQFLHEGGLVYQATWGWVAGGLAVHALLIVASWARGDREAVIGGVASLGAHAAFAWSVGILTLG